MVLIKNLVPHWRVYLEVHVDLKGVRIYYKNCQRTYLLASCQFLVLDPSQYFEHH